MDVVGLRGPRQAEVLERAEPEVRPGSVLVEIDRCGIGGSDVGAWLSGVLPAPAWFGHEWVGRVVEIGPAVVGRFLGERVVGAVPPPCGQCRHCVAGFAPHCELVLATIVGTDALASDHGAFAPRIRVDARRLFRVPDGLDIDTAALAEPAAVALHAVTRRGVELGDVAVVVGGGTIGLLVAELVREAGAGQVVVVEPDSIRREMACDLGANAAFGPGDGARRWLRDRGHGLGADLAIDCAGTGDSLVSSLGLVRRGGTVVVAGVAPGAPVAWSPVAHERQLSVQFSLGYTIGDVRRVMEMLVADRLRLGSLIDPELLGLHQVAAELAALESMPEGRRKRMVAPAIRSGR